MSRRRGFSGWTPASEKRPEMDRMFWGIDWAMGHGPGNVILLCADPAVYRQEGPTEEDLRKATELFKKPETMKLLADAFQQGADTTMKALKEPEEL